MTGGSSVDAGRCACQRRQAPPRPRIPHDGSVQNTPSTHAHVHAYLLRQRLVAVARAEVADPGAVLAEGLEERGAEGEAREMQLLEAVVFLFLYFLIFS